MPSLTGLVAVALAIFHSSGTLAHREHRRNLPALNPNPRNSVPNGDGPPLYYNGSGRVPGYGPRGFAEAR